MSYQLYRSTTLGNCLQETLDELISQQAISPQVAIRVLLEFDKSINQVATFCLNLLEHFLSII